MPPGGDTTSGGVLESTLVPALERHYTGRYKKRKKIPESGLGGRGHVIDLIVERDDGKQILISLKYQDVGGTVDEKVPYEVIKLIWAIQQSPDKYPYAYIVLGGTGFNPKLREYYLSGEMAKYIQGYDLVKIITIDQYLALCNRKQL